VRSEGTLVLAFDIGATWLRAALADGGGRILHRLTVRTARESRALEAQLAGLAQELLDKARALGGRVAAAGVGCIGPLDIREGVILRPPNLPVEHVEVGRVLREVLQGLPVYVLNDCTAACYGEWLLGAGRRVRNLAYVAIGTGIGGGAVVDGHLLLGWRGNAAEVGHLVVDARGRLRCGCGGRGHWEAHCSGMGMPRFLARWVSERGFTERELEVAFGKELARLTVEDIFAAARKGHSIALEFLEEVALLNAAGLASVISAFSPELLIIGGSVALGDYELVVEKALDRLGEFALNQAPLVRPATFGRDAVLMGAAALAIRPPEEFVRRL